MADIGGNATFLTLPCRRAAARAPAAVAARAKAQGAVARLFGDRARAAPAEDDDEGRVLLLLLLLGGGGRESRKVPPKTADGRARRLRDGPGDGDVPVLVHVHAAGCVFDGPVSVVLGRAPLRHLHGRGLAVLLLLLLLWPDEFSLDAAGVARAAPMREEGRPRAAL